MNRSRARRVPAVMKPAVVALALSLPLTASAQSSPPGYGAILSAVVRPTGVDVGALRARVTDVRAAHQWLATHGPTATPAAYASRDARLAYWINAYNLTVLLGVAEAPASMGNLLTYRPESGFFRRDTWRVDGRALTLDAIENREVRAVFHDPRVHVALNCGARSCPPLRATPYTAEHLSRELDAQATRWVNAPGGVRVDEAAHRVTVSQLFEWFADDLAGPIPGHAATAARGPLAFVYAYASPSLRASLTRACGADARGCAVSHAPYDWSLARAR